VRVTKIAGDLQLRAASRPTDAAFAWRVGEACIKPYAEQTWGRWDGQVDFAADRDEIITSYGWDIGVMRVERLPDHWFLSKLYLLPPFQRGRLGSRLLERLIADARRVRLPLRLTVLEVSPARRFYERHGFVLTGTVSPRHHLQLG
jgi:GNAT superfamily N-acetyltransferase